MSGVLYIPFIHSRHHAKDRSLGVGRDIRLVKLVGLYIISLFLLYSCNSLKFGLPSRIFTCTELSGHWRLFVFVSGYV